MVVVGGIQQEGVQARCEAGTPHHGLGLVKGRNRAIAFQEAQRADPAYLPQHLSECELTGGNSLAANIQLVLNNAALGAKIAASL